MTARSGSTARMRVIDCDECGETLQAANDDELKRRLKSHYAAEHDDELTDDDAEELVDGEAYEAEDA
jgi:predicted small metal-binding protein